MSKLFSVKFSPEELWELINAADQAASEPSEELQTAKDKLSAAHRKVLKAALTECVK